MAKNKTNKTSSTDNVERQRRRKIDRTFRLDVSGENGDWIPVKLDDGENVIVKDRHDAGIIAHIIRANELYGTVAHSKFSLTEIINRTEPARQEF